MPGFHRRHTELTCLLGVCSVVLGGAVPLYYKFCAALATRGVEFSTLGHIKAFFIAVVLALVGLVVLCLILGGCAWLVCCVIRFLRLANERQLPRV